MNSGGYFEGSAYESFGLYSTLIPTRIRFMAALHGYSTPDLTSRFSYCELGCGQAMSLLLSAALFPHAEFVGVDYSSSAIARAKGVAEQMGLTNLKLVCSDFATFTDSALKPFDFIVSHGVWTWVGPETQRSMVRILRDALAPSGVASLSANIIFGWQKALSIQHFLRCATAAAPPDDQAPLAKKLLGRLATATSDASDTKEKIAAILRQTPSYFSHEYLAPAWKPVTLLDLIAAIEQASLAWLGSGQARHCVESFWMAIEVAAAVPSDVPRPTRYSALDALMGTSFRAELFGKDNTPAFDEAKLVVLEQSRLTVLKTPLAGKAVSAVMKALRRTDAVYEEALVAQLKNGSVNAADLLILPAAQMITLDFTYDVICGLLAAGVCDVTLTTPPSETQREMIAKLNKARIALAEKGYEISSLVSPPTGALAPVDSIDLAHLIAETTRDEIVERAVALLRRKEAKVLVNGTVPPDSDAVLNRMAYRACGIWRQAGGKHLAALGIVPEGTQTRADNPDI